MTKKTPIFTFLLLFSILFLLSSCNKKASTYVYESKTPDFNFPEDRLNLKSTGICFSGGGTRAMTCAAGQMKAIDSLNLWKDVGYISSVSGGSWASSVFTFYRATKDGPSNDQELLGTPLGAKNLKLDQLKKPISPKHMTYAVTRDLSGRILELLLEDDFSLGLLEKPHDIWIDAVGETYLKPFGLYGGGTRYFTLNDSTMNEIIEREPNLNLTSKDFHLVHNQTSDAHRPYLVMNSSVLAPARYSPLPNPEKMSVFNYSALGVGSAKFNEISLDEGFEGVVKFPVGGGFIEPFAMGGSGPLQPLVPCGDKRKCAEIELQKRHKFRLADAVGTSSAAFAAQVAQTIPEELLTDILALGSIIPEEPYWSVGQKNTPAELYRFADGGSLENFGLISLLQRKVEKIVVFINTSSTIDTNFMPGIDIPNEHTSTYDFYTLFDNYKFGNHTHNQVFSLRDFVKVFNDFKSCIRSGKTVMSKMKTQTIANPLWGIKEGQQVEILWMYNYTVHDWEKQLHKNVRDEIKKGKEGLFPNFPWYSTIFPVSPPFLVGFTPEMTKLLYELQFWNVYENREAFMFLQSD